MNITQMPCNPGSYNGSAAVAVNIPSTVADAYINSLIGTKLEVIENGAY